MNTVSAFSFCIILSKLRDPRRRVFIFGELLSKMLERPKTRLFQMAHHDVAGREAETIHTDNNALDCVLNFVFGLGNFS